MERGPYLVNLASTTSVDQTHMREVPVVPSDAESGWRDEWF
jgi:hypothetical protein